MVTFSGNNSYMQETEISKLGNEIRSINFGEYTFDERVDLTQNESDLGKSIVLRITYHDLRDDVESQIKTEFGDDVRILTAKDVPFSTDPSDDVLDVIDTLEAQGGFDVVAVEVIGPREVSDSINNSDDIEAPLYKSVYAKDDNGRNIVVGKDPNTGRDVFKCIGFDEIERSKK
tara:strand:+ start:807 stop:1328 length:522 start_codon:yes stop_codon:yes gene_type:complete